MFMFKTAPLTNCVTSQNLWDKSSVTPEITGIPLDVLDLAEFKNMRKDEQDENIYWVTF